MEVLAEVKTLLNELTQFALSILGTSGIIVCVCGLVDGPLA